MSRRTRDPILPLDAWIASSVRRTVIALLTGLVILAIGVLWWLYLDARTAARVSDGRAVEAQVTAVRWEKVASVATAQRVTVRYAIDGRNFEATLMSVFDEGNYRTGQRVTVYADPDDPARVATADSFSSEGWAMRAPTYVCAVGISVILVVCVSRVIHLVRRRRAAR